MRTLLMSLALAASLLAGCGVEVAGTAATTGQMQAEQARQAKAQQEQVQKNLGVALQAGAAAASAAAGQ
jgi:uncharacterized protein YceK